MVTEDAPSRVVNLHWPHDSIAIILPSIRFHILMRHDAPPPQIYYILLHMVFINTFKQSDIDELSFLLHLLLLKRHVLNVAESEHRRQQTKGKNKKSS